MSPPPELVVIPAVQVFGALATDQIWRSRNAVIFEGAKIDMKKIQTQLLCRFEEHLASRNLVITREHTVRTERCIRPEKGVIKINCNAAVSQNRPYVAIVARDWRVTLVFAISKRVETIIPLQSEAEAIYWATQQALKLDT